MEYFLGLDIGGTKCALSMGCVTVQSQKINAIDIIEKKQFLTAGNTPQQVLEQFYTLACEMLQSRDMIFADLTAIGISCGGPLDSKSGIILSPPNLPAWDGIEIVSFFEEKTKVPVFLQNDANACAVAEWKLGAGAGCENMIFLTFGTGLGAGLILNGRLYCGASDMAGELGHIRLVQEGRETWLPTGYGKRGSAEGYCSGGGLAQQGIEIAKKALLNGKSTKLYEAAGRKLQNIDARLMAELARGGDPVCKRVYEDCGRRLGELISIAVDLLNPEKIVIGGIYMRAADLLIPTMMEAVEKETLRHAREACEIVPAGLGEQVGDYAALAVAVEGSGRM